MMLKLYSEALQVLWKNKSLGFLFFLSFYVSALDRATGLPDWILCFIYIAAQVIALLVELNVIGVVFKERNFVDSLEKPTYVVGRYFWKSFLVWTVTLIWIFITMSLPGLLVFTVRESGPELLSYILIFFWCIILNFLFFGLFNIGMMILISKNVPTLEAPAMGILELFRNFRHYSRIYLFTIILSYLPVFFSVMVQISSRGLNGLIEKSSLSFLPNISSYSLLFDSGARWMTILIFLILGIVQKIVLTLTYLDRPIR